MDETQRHGEVMGALGRIEQKADEAHVKLIRHERALEGHTEDIEGLNDAVSKGKGIAIAVTGGATVLALIGTVVAWAKGNF